jgi:hypothetical protein
MDITVPVDVPLVGDERRKNWAKVVHNVDPSKSSGWAFEGDFIAAGGIQDVPAGCVVLVYGERGSRDHPAIEARVFTANSDGTLTPEAAASGRAWARTLRDRIEELLDGPRFGEAQHRGPSEAAPPPRPAGTPSGRPSGSTAPVPWGPDLARYGDEAILEEARRRGLVP